MSHEIFPQSAGEDLRLNGNEKIVSAAESSGVLNPPSVDNLVKIAKAMGVRVTDLVVGF